jgi:hypothetical protein
VRSKVWFSWVLLIVPPRDENHSHRFGNVPPSEKNGRQKLGAHGYARRSAVLAFSLIVVLELGTNALRRRVELGV